MVYAVISRLLLPLAGEGLSGGVELQYVGPRLTLGGNELGGFVLTNVTFLSTNLGPGLDLSAGVYILFDKLYSDPGSRGNTQDAIEQDGRHVRFKLTWKF